MPSSPSPDERSGAAPRAVGTDRPERRLREVHAADYARVLYKRRWSAMTVFFIVVVSMLSYSFSLTPIYEARAQILIEREAGNVAGFKDAAEQSRVADDYYQTQYRLLQSRGLARRTITALNLWTRPLPAVKAGLTGNLTAALVAPLDLVRGWMRRDSAAQPTPRDETAAESARIDWFLSNLTITPVRSSRLVDVRYRSPDPALAATIANALARAYIEQSLEFKFTASREASDWLTERLREQRRQVEATEQALQRYREQTDAVSLEERQNIVVQKLADLNAAVTRAKTERIQKESAYAQIRSMQNDRATLDTIPAILANGFVQQQKATLADLQRQQVQLADKLGPNHPDMVKLSLAIRTTETKLQGEIAKIVQGMRNDYEAALAQERSLTSALEQQKRDALELNRKGIDYGVLQRDAATNRQIYDNLLQRTKETEISGELKTTNIRIVDAAETPRQPVEPDTRSNLKFALLIGTVLGVAVAFAFESLDNRLKNPDEVRHYLSLPFLGMVPAVTADLSRSVDTDGIPAEFIESFRAIRTNVIFSVPDNEPRVVAITSTGPGEGKTLVSANLAMALAHAGLRVLLLDGDMRKPRVHAAFHQAKDPGLSNVLVGTAKASEAVRSTQVAGLWILPSGAQPPNPAELLGSKRFNDLVQSLKQHFDYIIIDTPPVLAVTDSCVVAHVATGVIYVVGAEMTSRFAAQRGLEQLEHAGAVFLGAVLNRVDLRGNAYYYAPYYRREYSAYYRSAS